MIELSPGERLKKIISTGIELINNKTFIILIESPTEIKIQIHIPSLGSQYMNLDFQKKMPAIADIFLT